MTSVHEEEDDGANHPPATSAENHLSIDKLNHPRSCNERSDSGFSECSNCSTPSASCLCNLTLLDKNQSIIEEKSSSSSSSSNEPEETTESIGAETEGKAAADESFTVSSDHDIRSEISSLEYDDANKSTCDDNQNVVVSIRVPTRRELFQDEHGGFVGRSRTAETFPREENDKELELQARCVFGEVEEEQQSFAVNGEV